MLKKLRTIYHEFPPRFWIVVGASFIDSLGGKLIFPFFTLYITQKFNVGMTEAGALLGTFSIAGLLGNMLGGALTDRFGRRGMVLFGLVFSALSAVSMGLVNQLAVFYVLAVFVGLLSDIAGPAWQAMMADILPEEKRAEGFSILRVVGNLTWIIGPSIGGIVAQHSYLVLFIADAIASLITASIIFRMIPETKPEVRPGEKQEGMLKTLAGYGKVFRDWPFVSYIVVTMLMTVVYLQMYSSLGVYLRDVHGVSTQGYGFVLSMSAITVVILQFWVTRRVKLYPPMLMMALGAGFYMVGFSMYGYATAYALFLLAVVLITMGEMIIMPVSQALAANFAPEDMRGRYMAMFGLAWMIPSAFGPLAAGLIMDNFDPRLIWYIGGVLCFISVLGFFWLHRATRARFAAPVTETAI